VTTDQLVDRGIAIAERLRKEPEADVAEPVSLLANVGTRLERPRIRRGTDAGLKCVSLGASTRWVELGTRVLSEWSSK
jgi:hypothetical protein